MIEPGKLHRFPGIGKRPSNRAGWCLLFDDRLGGCFGDWSSGIEETWQASRNKLYSQTERAEFARRVEAARAQAEAERAARQAQAAKRSAAIWGRATTAPEDHPYLIRKHIQAHGARLYKGALTLPVIDFTDKLTSLQFIDTEGRKRLLSEGRKQGCFIPIVPTQYSQNAHKSSEPGIFADIADSAYRSSKIVICEGWATGCTLAEDEPAALVLAAIDAGNLEPVAVIARRRWPSSELVIAGDDDRLTRGNPGATKARAAAIASGALLALPQWPPDAPESLTDFNDLAVWLERGSL